MARLASFSPTLQRSSNPHSVPATIPVIVCIDVEPDPRAVNPEDPADWIGFEKTLEDLGDFSALLEDATKSPVYFAWFLRMDPQIEYVYSSPEWVMSRYGRQIRSLEKIGDGVGLHIHPWRWDEDAECWIADFTGRRWGEHCVQTGFAAFERAFGRPCRISRFGDQWLTNHILTLAERLGARYELSAEPGRSPTKTLEPSIGLMPDYSSTPRHPYQPSVENCLKPDGASKRELWMIPLSTGRMNWPSEVLRERACRLDRKSPAETGGRYQGWIDRVDAQHVAGWAWDLTRPERTVDVEVYDGDHRIATAPAGLYRPDLVEAGIGNGRHGFLYPVADALRDGRKHKITVRAAGTDFRLKGGPVRLRCRSGEPPSDDYRTLNLGDDPAIICNFIEALLSTEANLYLAIVMRSSYSACRRTRLHIKRSLEFLATHPRASEFRFVPPADAVDMISRAGLR